MAKAPDSTQTARGSGCTERADAFMSFLTIAAPVFGLLIGASIAFYYRTMANGATETVSAALALLHTGTIADPYAGYTLPTGPTAHVSPVTTLVFAAVYWIFGERTLPAQFVLGLAAAISYALCIGFAFRSARCVGAGPVAFATIALLSCVFPIWIYDFVVLDRVYDQPIASALLMYIMYLFIFLRSEAVVRFRSAVVLGLAVGVGGLALPTILPVCMIALGEAAWRRRDDWMSMRRLGFSVVLCGLIVIAWMIRNYIQVGAFNLRSNLGLELASGNYDGALGFYDADASAVTIHPSVSPAAAAVLASIGEPAYNARTWNLGMTWIYGHPGQFMVLSLKRVWISFFPTRFMVGLAPILGTYKWFAFSIFGAMKAISLSFALVFIRDWLLLAFCVIPILPYYFLHVDFRYTCLVAFPYILLIGIVAEDWSRRILNDRVLPA